MVGEMVSAILVVALWGYLLVKLRALHWRLHDAAQRANCLSLFAVSLSMTVFHPPVYRAIDRIVGVPNSARLLGNSLGVIGAWAFQPVVMRLLHYGERKRGVFGSAGLMVGTIVTMAVLFSRASVPIEAPTDFQVRYSTAPYIAEYRLILLLYIGLLISQLFSRSLRNRQVVRSIPRSYLRLQARVQTIGWGLGTAYAGLECGYIVLALLGIVPPHSYPTALAYALFAGGCIALVSGGLLGVYRWGEQYRAYRLLYPLWRDLYEATPDIALDPPRSAYADALTFRDLDLRLYRRVMEIQDGVAMLQRYTTAGMRDRARAVCDTVGIAKNDAPVCVEAIVWAAAVQAKQRGWRVPIPVTTPVTRGVVDLDAELHYLQSVARAYRRLAPRAASLVDEILDAPASSTRSRRTT